MKSGTLENDLEQLREGMRLRAEHAALPPVRSEPLLAEVERLRRDNADLRTALEQAKTLLIDKYEFEQAASLVELLKRTANNALHVQPGREAGGL